MIKRIESTLKGWLTLAQMFERVLVDNMSATTPWLAPLIPAYLVYRNMIGQLGYPLLFGFVGAAAVEFLGLSAINTALTFWQYNDTKRQSDPPAPSLIAFAAGLFYIVIILTVNAALQIWPEESWVKILAHALLSLLSVDAAIIIAIRAQHARMLAKIADEKEQRRQDRLARRSQESQASRETPTGFPRDRIVDYETYVRRCAELDGKGPIKPKTLIKEHGVSRSTAYRWHADYLEKHNGQAEESQDQAA